MYERFDDVAKKKAANGQGLISSNPLGKFIVDEINKRHVSATQFAKDVDVSTSTITHAINGETAEPSLPFLHKLAKYTSTPLSALIALAYPDVAGDIDTVPPDILVLAFRLYRLPDVLRKAVISMVNSE